MITTSLARRAALVAALFVAPAWSSATIVRATVVRVLDGDTVQVRVPAWRATPFEVLSVRVLGIDTPETHAALAKCPLELERGAAASAFAATLMPVGAKLRLTSVSPDKYGGRIDAKVLLEGNRDLADLLSKAGHARPYTGKGPKPDWCSAPA